MLDNFRNLFGKTRLKPQLTTEERFLKLKKILNPQRKNPDFTNPEANKKLAQIMGKNLPYNLDNLWDLDKIFHDLRNLTPSQQVHLCEFITIESDSFVLFVKEIKKPVQHEYSNPNIYKIILELERKPHKVPNLQYEIETEKEIPYDLVMNFNIKTKVLEIATFYPTNASLRGYSIGAKILREIERIAKVFETKEITILDPTTDALGFYYKQDFEISKYDKTNKISELKKLI